MIHLDNKKTQKSLQKPCFVSRHICSVKFLSFQAVRSLNTLFHKCNILETETIVSKYLSDLFRLWG